MQFEDIRKKSTVLAATAAGVLGFIATATAPARQESHKPHRRNTTRQLGVTAMDYTALKAKPHRNRQPRLDRIPKLHLVGPAFAGQTSTFGPPAEAAGLAKDGKLDNIPCIALRSDSTVDKDFLVTVNYRNVIHWAILKQCDTGPGILTREIDITGDSMDKFHPVMPPQGEYPTDHAWGVAREIAGPYSSQTSPLKATMTFPQAASLTFSASHRQ